MIIDKALEELLRGEISKSGGRKSFHRGAFVNIMDKLILDSSDLPPQNKDTYYIRSFDMNIRYTPREKGEMQCCPYCITAYMFPNLRVRVENWEGCLVKSREDSEEGKILSWILRNTNLCKELFDLASENQECVVPIAFDALQYKRKIAGESNVAIFNTPMREEIEKVYQKIYRDEYLKSERARKKAENELKKEAKGCQH